MEEALITDIYNFRAAGPGLATGGQPSLEELSAVGRAGFEVVINLGLKDDPRYSVAEEPEHVLALRMEYIHIPVKFDNPAREDLESFFQEMDRCVGKRIFIHCAANKRVSVFLGLYRLVKLNWPQEKAFELMAEIWRPDEIWSAFIQRMVEVYGQ